MATKFYRDHVPIMRALRKGGATMAQICATFERHTRDQVLELIDAVIRHQDDWQAYLHVNKVLDLQRAGVQLVNGRVASQRPRPMF